MATSKTTGRQNELQKLVGQFKSILQEEPAINSYLLVVFITGVLLVLYVALVGTFPFNSFLAAFISCVASFVLVVSLKKTGDFKGFLFAHLVLHLAVFMLMG